MSVLVLYPLYFRVTPCLFQLSKSFVGDTISNSLLKSGEIGL